MDTTDHDPASSDSLYGPTLTADESSTSVYAYGRSEESESDIRPFFETSTEEKRLVRKLDRRILPIMCLLYLFAYLDRTSLGNARLQGLPEDVLGGDPTGHLFDWVNSAFFFPYVLFMVPATVCSKLFPPRIWIALATIGWGLCSTLMATAFDFGGLLTARIGLGIFEAGFSAVAVLYLSFFYTKHEVGLRMAYWFSFSAVAGAFGGLIAFGIQQVHVTIANWRLLFIIEGIPTVLLGMGCFFFLPDRPESTIYLTKEEQKLATDRMSRDASRDNGAFINKKHIWAAFQDWRLYVAGIMGFGANCALASISAFLPTIIVTFGATPAMAQLLTVPPYAAAAIVLTGTSYFSDRTQSRGLYMAVSSVVASIGYILLLTIPDNEHARYFATFCITSGAFTTIGIVIAWFAHNLGSETKKATGLSMAGTIGLCGAILGSHIFPKTEGPRYIRGFAISCGLQLLGAFCAIVLTTSYRLENRRRDRLYGKPVADARVDTTELADKAPAFRYVP
ncbi:hypothetical protein PILCRDRAFT_673 [Piloderma croceum F 1598]|uniref:Major facilitator superfamily (MFS) profile domain-containing protein n=1 Tax=Piloderma croceum (strain F 1598) TaxID=765440 RepID=A0A0C3GIP8_PILCF|nr:hypothetical protein PILCRDRAFT_673 [Piloderma croceum F 1598]